MLTTAKVENKPPQFDAVKFEGGVESATEIIQWIQERTRRQAFYAPPLKSERGDSQEYVIIKADRVDTFDWHVRPGCWIVHERIAQGPFVFCENDEILAHMYNVVG